MPCGGRGAEGAAPPPAPCDLTALQQLEKTTVVATVQCGGNRRAEMNAVAPTSGIAWGAGAISTARWGGVRLRALSARRPSSRMFVIVFSGVQTI